MNSHRRRDALEPADVLIVGAGPAGIAAALWLHDLELRFDWVEAASAPGGALRRIGNPIRNFPGAQAGTGAALCRKLGAQLAECGLAPRCGTRLPTLRREEGRWRSAVGSHAHVLLATGTSPRTLPGLGVRGVRGVEGSVTRTRHRYAGREVVVVGGGDAALEGVLLLLDVGCHVHLVHRRCTFRAQERFEEGVRESPHVTLHLSREVRSLQTQGGRITGVTLDDGSALRAEGLFIRIGVAPQLPGFPEGDAPRTHEEGYVAVDASGRTSAPGLWAAGDLTSSDHQSIAWASGMGARSAAAIAACLASD